MYLDNRGLLIFQFIAVDGAILIKLHHFFRSVAVFQSS